MLCTERSGSASPTNSTSGTNRGETPSGENDGHLGFLAARTERWQAAALTGRTTSSDLRPTRRAGAYFYFFKSRSAL